MNQVKFEKDVFISYAHLDDKPLDDGAKGWISDFHTLLETRLEQTIGHEILIWRDAKLTGNEIFAPEIESQLPKLKLMVSIITPRYLVSDWCRREMGAFYKAAAQNGGLSIGNKSRLFKIVKTPVDREIIRQLPEEIHDVFSEILDYKFYVQDQATGRFRELSRNSWVDNATRQEYMNKLDDVVQDMANLIRQFNNSGQNQAPPRKIYLAETSYDMLTYRDNVARELEEAGFVIYPNKNLPLTAERYAAAVKQSIDECMMSVHIISNTSYAMQPEGTDQSIVMLQNDIAATRSEAGTFRRLIWIPSVAEGSSPGGNANLRDRQARFVHDVKTNPAQQIGADLLIGPLEEFKLAVFDTIHRVEAEEKAGSNQPGNPEVTENNVRSAAPVVYMICDERDLENTRPLEDALSDHGCEILLPAFEGDGAQLRQAHLDNLKICDAIIIYYGFRNYRWVSSMKSDLMRLPALGRTVPLLDRLIYIAGPADEDKQRFRSNDIRIVDGIAGFDATALTGFFSNLA